MIVGLWDVVGSAGFVLGFAGLVVSWLQARGRNRDLVCLRAEMDRERVECLTRLDSLALDLKTAEASAQSSLELLRDGRLSLPARARALQMLRSGVSAETAAGELGMARSEVRLLQKVAAVLAMRN